MDDTNNYRVRCNALLIALLGRKDLVERWWTIDNKAFQCTPEEQWEKDYMSVYRYLLGYVDGYG